MKFLYCVSLLFFSNVVFADLPVALIGGQGNAPYAAFVEADGSVNEVKGLPPTGLTYRVATNSFGVGITGGTNALNAYAALVAPNGIAKSVPGLPSPGEIYTVGINKYGVGIIGGGHLISSSPFTAIPYAAIVSPDGIATSLTPLPSSGLIYSVAIDSNGVGIIGGIGDTDSAYAAIVSANGTLNPIVGLPATGAIFWVAQNESLLRFIGGTNGSSIYAAYVAPNGSLAPIGVTTPGTIYSVAINANGTAIMGGNSSMLPYAAQVAPNGSVRKITNLPTSQGTIYNVTINNSGTGLIAGFSASGPYGAFVSPHGTLTELIGLPKGNGFLDGAALDPSGIALVGGSINHKPFAAFAAPNGTLTYLNGLPSTGEINSISLIQLSDLVPEMIGPFNAFANTQFAESDVLTQHCMIHHWLDLSCCEQPCQRFSLWASPFGDFIHEKTRNSIPGLTNGIGGVLIGFDYNVIENGVIGAGFAYAHNSVRYFKNLGHAEIDHESFVLYGSLNRTNFYINAALWAGIFQADHVRNSLLSITSKAHPKGSNVTPHFELGVPFTLTYCIDFVVDPFVTFDWFNNWQSNFHEHGTSGFNIVMDNQYNSVFRSEVGIRLFETFHDGWGCLIFEEKASFVNKSPNHRGRGHASFIGSHSSFDVVTFDHRSQNHGIIQVHAECLPSNSNIYASVDYQGEFGSSFQSNLVTLSAGINF